MKLGRALFAVVVAAALLGALVATASAARLSSTSQTIRATFARVSFAGGFGTNECALTLEGSFHSRTIAKTAGVLAGYVTSAILGSCIRGRGTILTASLPWHTRYASFAGTLPNITAIAATITGPQWQIQEPVFGVTCLASGGTLTATFNREAGGALTTIVLGGSSPTNCGISGTLSGTSNAATVLGAATRITVTLI
jgi:hypothetical protein